MRSPICIGFAGTSWRGSGRADTCAALSKRLRSSVSHSSNSGSLTSMPSRKSESSPWVDLKIACPDVFQVEPDDKLVCGNRRIRPGAERSADFPQCLPQACLSLFAGAFAPKMRGKPDARAPCAIRAQQHGDQRAGFLARWGQIGAVGRSHPHRTEKINRQH